MWMTIQKMKTSMLILSIIMLGASAAQEEEKTPERQAKLGFLGTNSIAQLAQDLFSRSTTSSQVLSLNLTNLVILLVVKALIFGAGSLGFGGHDHLGRSLDDQDNNIPAPEPFLSESEILLMLGYLKGDITHKYSCLNFAACQDPRKAKQYLTASNILVKGVNMFNLSADGRRYEKMLEEVQEAVNHGTRGHDCSARYTCQEKL